MCAASAAARFSARFSGVSQPVGQAVRTPLPWCSWYQGTGRWHWGLLHQNPALPMPFPQRFPPLPEHPPHLRHRKPQRPGLQRRRPLGQADVEMLAVSPRVLQMPA
ncbi:MAG: hypothetical protein ACK5QX_09455, partial [bacterium]